MRTVIIYKSIHHENTKKIAQVLGKELNAKILEVENFKEDLNKFDLIGFGSGIYAWRHHQKILDFVDNLPNLKGKKAFIFSTSGARFLIGRAHIPLKNRLLKKGFEVVGEFNCLGWDTFGPLKLFGGINKGRPNEADFHKAEKFAKKLKNI